MGWEFKSPLAHRRLSDMRVNGRFFLNASATILSQDDRCDACHCELYPSKRPRIGLTSDDLNRQLPVGLSLRDLLQVGCCCQLPPVAGQLPDRTVQRPGYIRPEASRVLMKRFVGRILLRRRPKPTWDTPHPSEVNRPDPVSSLRRLGSGRKLYSPTSASHGEPRRGSSGAPHLAPG